MSFSIAHSFNRGYFLGSFSKDSFHLHWIFQNLIAFCKLSNNVGGISRRARPFTQPLCFLEFIKPGDRILVYYTRTLLLSLLIPKLFMIESIYILIFRSPFCCLIMWYVVGLKSGQCTNYCLICLDLLKLANVSTTYQIYLLPDQAKVLYATYPGYSRYVRYGNWGKVATIIGGGRGILHS